jgi:hypothetical protein
MYCGKFQVLPCLDICARTNMVLPTASVVLSPISPLGPESSITRSFTLSSRNPVFEIGRSSKREVKNRTPAKDNGWFDSRVMSRDHAELGFNMDKEVSSLCLPPYSFSPPDGLC